jgi:hypothetical protein
LSVAKELVSASPAFKAKASKLPPELILNDQNCGVILFGFLEKRDQTAAIGVHIEQTHPLTRAIVARKLSDQIT